MHFFMCTVWFQKIESPLSKLYQFKKLTLHGLESHFNNEFSMNRLIFFLAVLRILKGMPLCNWTTWGCQHVWPVTQFCSLSAIAQNHFSNGFRCTNTIIVNNSNYKLYFLKIWKLNKAEYINFCRWMKSPNAI